MKIYSWNLYIFNKEPESAVRFIETLDFDVLCLQEVTPRMLVLLKQLPYHIVYHVDIVRAVPKGAAYRDYVVILSKHEFKGHHTFQFPDFPFPRYVRFLIRLLSRVRMEWVNERGGIYADVLIGKRLVRVFSVHLTLWGPKNRASEFALVASLVDPAIPAVITGDFNVIEYGPLKLLNALLGASVRESLPTYPERKLFEARFKEFDFENPLRGRVTHDFSRSQLDHILVSRSLVVESTMVLPELCGSDHHPIGVEIRDTA